MPKKRVQKQQTFSADAYFEPDEGFCPFKGLDFKPSKPSPTPTAKKPSKPLSQSVYDMYTPGCGSIVQKNEELPIQYLRDCGPQDSMDLHGCRPERDDIPAMVNDFLADAVRRELKKVQIIVGKGKHSNGEPIIPSLVESTLKRSPAVREFSHAPSDRGGSGSFWVILGRKQAKAKPVNRTAPSQTVVRQTGKIDYDAYMPKAEDILNKK